MKSLADALLAPQRRDRVVDDTVKLIESHVSSRSGLRGMSLKTGLAMVKAAKPGILERAVRKLLPDFAQALDPLYQEFSATPHRDFAAYLQQHSGRATSALLAVADARIGQASGAAQSAYARLRSSAEVEVHAALPALSRLLGQHSET